MVSHRSGETETPSSRSGGRLGVRQIRPCTPWRAGSKYNRLIEIEAEESLAYGSQAELSPPPLLRVGSPSARSRYNRQVG